MSASRSTAARRNQVLSREQIIDTAVDFLDTGGERALTVRALTERPATGPGRLLGPGPGAGGRGGPTYEP
ncbi:hypothetical protein [Streptomyces sp. TLI_171]|uniref:hypothetical protein n=1 Tax=Streptomyces sp. TLI_171 TaxID=1938859 RepID=UPI00117F737C|nr:hypothetical protein [Streptomyces sp. TLI_171]